MASSFQNEIPKARVNIRLDLHTGGAQKKVELPLKLLVTGRMRSGESPGQLLKKMDPVNHADEMINQE